MGQGSHGKNILAVLKRRMGAQLDSRYGAGKEELDDTAYARISSHFQEVVQHK